MVVLTSREALAEALCRGGGDLMCINYDRDVQGGCSVCERQAAGLFASGAVIDVAAFPLSLADTRRIVDHLIHDGTRDGLILGNLLNTAMGASVRRRAALAAAAALPERPNG